MHVSAQPGLSPRPVQAFENELRKHLATERDVAAIVPMSNIGCLCVETAPPEGQPARGGHHLEDPVR